MHDDKAKATNRSKIYLSAHVPKVRQPILIHFLPVHRRQHDKSRSCQSIVMCITEKCKSKWMFYKHLPMLVRFFPAKGEGKMDFDTIFSTYLEHVPASKDRRDISKTQQLSAK